MKQYKTNMFDLSVQEKFKKNSKKVHFRYKSCIFNYWSRRSIVAY